MHYHLCCNARVGRLPSEKVLVVLLGNVNHAFWSQLEYSGQKATIFSCQGILFRIALEEIIIIKILLASLKKVFFRSHIKLELRPDHLP